MTKIRTLFIALTLAMVVTGCASSGVPQKPQTQKTNTVTQSNIIINQGANTFDAKVLDKFLTVVSSKNPAILQVKRFTDEGDPILQTWDYKDGLIRYTYDNSQDKFAGIVRASNHLITRT